MKTPAPGDHPGRAGTSDQSQKSTVFGIKNPASRPVYMLRLEPDLQTRRMLLIATHEAGHAVAWWWLDRTGFLGRRYNFPWLRHVAIARRGEVIFGSGGEARPELAGICASDTCINPTFAHFVTPTLARKLAFADVVHVMAGPISECIEEGEPLVDAFDWGDHAFEEAFGAGEEIDSDSWQVEMRIPLLGRRWRGHLLRAFTVANRIVREHQPQVRELAEALVERGEIDGEEVYRLFEKTGR